MKLQPESYQRGVQDVLDLARRVGEGLKRSSEKPTRTPFAIAALLEFADAAEEYLLGKKPGGQAVPGGESDPKPPQAGEERMTAPPKSPIASE